MLCTTQPRALTTLRREAFENIEGKGENAGNQHFLLFPQCFLPFPKQISSFEFTFDLWSTNAFNLGKSIILLFGKELRSFNGLLYTLADPYQDNGFQHLQDNHDINI